LMNDDNSMQDKLIDTLVMLQEAETEIIRLREFLEKIEKEKNKQDAKLKQFRTSLTTHKDKMSKLNADCLDIEKEIELFDERIVKSNGKLRMVKTNKEYQLCLREVDDMKKRKDSQETALLELLDEKEELEKLVLEFEKEFTLLESQVLSEKEDIEKKVLADRELLDDYIEKRAEIGKTLDPSLMKHFLRISKMNRGLAVVQAKNGACMGCFLSIPPQLYIEIQRNNKLISCPQCSRFLYFKQENESV